MTTPNLDLSYPVSSDPDNVPADLQALAEAVDAKVGGAWTSWAPVINNLTVGLGALGGKKRRIGASLRLLIDFHFGSGSAVTGPLSLVLPDGLVTPNDGLQQNLDGRIGKTRFVPVDVSFAPNASTGSIAFNTGGGTAGGTADTYAAVTATLPATEGGPSTYTTWAVSNGHLVIYGEIEVQLP